jgi:hypothetical protein
MEVAGWKYKHHVPEARRIALASAGSFHALLQLPLWLPGCSVLWRCLPTQNFRELTSVLLSLRPRQKSGFVSHLALTDPTADLDIERWMENARRGVHLAKLGLMAPEITKEV